jgi:hypothetical protein
MPENVSDRCRLLQKRFHNTMVLIISIVVTAMVSLVYNTPEPYHTSLLTGQGWVLELLTGHPERIRCELGVHVHVFTLLINELRAMGLDNSKFVSLEEQLAIFLYACVTGLSIRHLGERFQRSNETISKSVFFLFLFKLITIYYRCFRRILLALSSPPFFTKYVRFPKAGDPIPPEIRRNAQFYPFFRDAIGAIDGTHIPAVAPAAIRGSFRNRKGFISQNCLFGCSFNACFNYALTGWEGATDDAYVYENAKSQGFVVPEGKYFLADAGYPNNRPDLLIPYRGVRYHLAEWSPANAR